MASSKTLIRAGASMTTRFLNRAYHTSPNPFLSPKPVLIAARRLLPSLFMPQSQKNGAFPFPAASRRLQVTQKAQFRRIPLPFWPTFSPLLAARRKSTQGGQTVIARRIAKGRYRITA